MRNVAAAVRAFWVLPLPLLLLVSIPAQAVEGGLGRSITGMQVTDYAGVVPPDPGLSLVAGYVYYSGDIGADRELPISGRAALGMDATFSLYSVSGFYVWPLSAGRWNFASMATVPFADVDIEASLAVGDFREAVSDSLRGDLYDMSFAPVVAGYHIDEARHLSLALYVSAPTGDYDPDRLANASLNVWVYSPTVSYTQLMHEGTVDWSTSAGIDFSTRNDATDYRSGDVLHVDTQLVKHFANGWGVGGVAGWIEQISDDEGALADRLDGFRGSAWALGATINYTHKRDDRTIALSARWLHEFDVKRRLAGDPVMLSGTITF